MESIHLSYQYDSKRQKYWRVERSIPVEMSNGSMAIIPEGMETDLSSVPKFLWGICPPFGDFLLAPLLHDYLYQQKKTTRAFADYQMLWVANRVNSKNIFRKSDNLVRYLAVRAFGWMVWM